MLDWSPEKLLSAPKLGMPPGGVQATYNIFQNSLGSGFAPESRLTSCTVFRQTASVQAEIELQVAV
jgi:hypothetical protein